MVTYEVAAFIQVISAFDICNSLPAKEDMTVTEPVKKDVMATAMVTDNTNKHSWMVDLKHSGRASGSLIGGELVSPSSGSFVIASKIYEMSHTSETMQAQVQIRLLL